MAGEGEPSPAEQKVVFGLFAKSAMDDYMKKYKRAITILLLIGLAFALGLTWRWMEGTPQYTLYRIGSSLKNRDFETFLLYVDLDNILKQQVAESFSALFKASNSDGPLGKLLGPLGGIKITLIPGDQNGLAGLARQELENYLKDQNNPTLPSAFLLLSVAQFNTRDDLSLVTLKKDSDQLRMAMRKTAGTWRVIEFNPEDTQRLIKKYLLQ
jgi:hypothetical protein